MSSESAEIRRALLLSKFHGVTFRSTGGRRFRTAGKILGPNIEIRCFGMKNSDALD